MTDDRETYALGNYYVSYQRAFVRTCKTTLAHPLEPLPYLDTFDLVVLGHAAIENYARIRGSRFLPSQVRNQLWIRHEQLRRLRRTSTPLVVITKNDYKHFELKNAFIRFVNPDLVVTQHRSAMAKLLVPEGRLIWLPFGVDRQMFTPASATREFVLGFRANSNTDWNGGERERLFRALTRLEGVHPVSLTLSRKGEGFLVGDPYVKWMQSCALLGNSVSAVGTVGPRFLEAMACGTVPIAPRNEYEGLLIADVHYVALDDAPPGDFPALETAVSRFLEDREYRERLHRETQNLAGTHDVENHVAQILREVGVS